MTIATLEKKLKPLEAPVENELLRWLYLHLPPQPIKNRKMHRGYSEAVRILMRESGSLDARSRTVIGKYLSAIIPSSSSMRKKSSLSVQQPLRKCWHSSWNSTISASTISLRSLAASPLYRTSSEEIENLRESTLSG